MVRLFVNVQFIFKPLSTSTSSSRTKKFFWQKMLVWTPQGVYQVWSLLADICKCPVSSQTIKYRYKCKSNQKILLAKNDSMDPLKVCTKFQVSRTSLSQKNLTNRRSSSRNGHDKSRGSNLFSNSSRTNNFSKMFKNLLSHNLMFIYSIN